MKKAALHNLGCKVNSYETEAMQQLLEQAGYEIVPFSEPADVYVINTCSVTNMADRKSRQMLHRARKQNPQAILVAAGCYVQTAGEEVCRKLDVDVVLGNNRKSELLESIEACVRQKQGRSESARVENRIDINDGKQTYEELHLSQTAEHTRAFIKVQDGCNQFCSYCIIPYARGRVRSRDPKQVVEEIRELAKKGYQEVVLTGIHLSSYGVDCEESLLHLIEQVHQIPGIRRIRLGSLEPKIVTEEFVKALSTMDKICPHFHLSLQSGCDATLGRMNRKYTTEEYAAGCELLRRYFAHPAITTDVIVGFPGETEEEFAQTREFLKKIRFYEMHVFKYSKRKGTRAAVMEHQVPEEIKTRRSAELIALGAEMSQEFREKFTGSKQEVLLEETAMIGDRKYYVGYTREYVKLAVESQEDLRNVLATVEIRQPLTEEIWEAGLVFLP